MAEKPIKEFRAGTVKAAIWLDKIKSKGGYDINQYSVKITKSYKNTKGEWKETDCLFAEDLPKVVLVAQKAWEFVALNLGDES